MSHNKYALARRSIWYILRTLLAVALIAVLCLGAFTTAMHISSIYILVTEGLELRADYILSGGDTAQLTEYFSEGFVAGDAALSSGKYNDFNITNHIYRLEIKRLFVLPWERATTVKVYEKMLSLSGGLKDGIESTGELPPWTPALYNVRLKKTKGRWYITGMDLLAENPAEEVLPTPDMSALATPEP